MADIKIRNLDDRLHETYKAMAERAGISLEEQLRRVLADHISDERRQMIARLREGREQLREKYGVMPDSTPGIRADRDRRG
jgi:plasmid stability protein